jgi:hypothetical protein
MMRLPDRRTGLRGVPGGMRDTDGNVCVTS